jgi:hypothetical protein
LKHIDYSLRGKNKPGAAAARQSIVNVTARARIAAAAANSSDDERSAGRHCRAPLTSQYREVDRLVTVERAISTACKGTTVVETAALLPAFLLPPLGLAETGVLFELY